MTANTSGFETWEVNNLLVPAYGNTRVLKVFWPNGGPYEINTWQVLFDQVPYIAQSVSLDLRNAAGTPIFQVSDILYERPLTVGQVNHFNFPSIKQCEYRIIGAVTGDIIAFFYNYPLFNY